MRARPVFRAALSRRPRLRAGLVLGCVLALAPVTAAASPPVPPLPVPTVPGLSSVLGGGWIVTLADGASVDAVARDARAPVGKRFTEALTGFSARLDGGQVERLRADPRVRSVIEDTVVARLPGDVVPPATTAPSTQYVPEHLRRIGVSQSRTARVDGVDQPLDADVAVLDDGIDRTHPDLDVVSAVDCVGDGVLLGPDGHGTEVAGMAAARDNRIGTVGSAPGARLWSVRIFANDGTLTESALLCGLEHVRRNAARIDTAVMAFEGPRQSNTVCGLGRTTGPGGRPSFGVADPIALAICRVRAAGVLPVASAGNSSTDAANTIPASYPQVLAVSAMTDTDGRPGRRGPVAACYPTERDDTFASYSSYGRVVDLSAPGTCVPTTFLGGTYFVDIGTSFSAPLVAGAAALLEARDRRAHADSMTATLQRTKERGALPGDPDGAAEGIVNAATF